MQQFFEIIPVVLFFLAYYMKGYSIDILGHTFETGNIYTATGVLMAATAAHLLITFLATKKLEKRLVLLAVVIFVTGGLTLVLHNNKFIMWKPTLFNWALAIAFLVAPYFMGKKTLMEKMLGGQIELPAGIWHKLNRLWIANFLIVGGLNLIVAYSFSESFWVSYKLYSSIGFTLIITIITGVIIAPHLKNLDKK